MAADPLAGVALDESWVRRFEQVEATWSAQSRAVAAFEHVAAVASAVASAVPVPAGADGSGAAVRLTFEDSTMVSLWGVNRADVAALAELARTPGNRIVAAAAPEATRAGWRLRFSLTGQQFGPAPLVMDASTLS